MADAGPSCEPVNVLLVADDESYDRLGSIVQHLCVGMIDDPVQLRVLLRTKRAAAPDAIGPVRVLTVRQRRWPLEQGWAGWVLEDLEGQPPEIIHGLSAGLCRWAGPAAAAWKCRMVAHVTDLTDARQFRSLTGARGLLGIVVTARLHELMLHWWPPLGDRLRMIPFGVPAEAEPACLDDPKRIPSAVVSTPLTAGCGLNVVLQAVQKLVRGGQPVQLFVLSSGRGESGFRRQVDRLGIRGQVTFAGVGSDWDVVQAVMAGADFFIEPNPNRRFSAHTLGAMANGLAILAPQGTPEDYLIDGTTARLFDPARPDDLAGQWGELLLDRSRARRLAQSALDYARGHHQATRMVAATVALYQEARP